MRFRLFGRVFYVSKAALIIGACIICALAAVVGNVLLSENTGRSGITISTAAPTDALTPEKTSREEPTPAPTSLPVIVAIHLTGCIENEGVYYIADNSILSDAVALAGGLTEDADTYVINLAMHIHDGMHIHIPSVNDTDKNWILEAGEHRDPGGSQTPAAPSLININTASSSELQQLSGVGESTAQDIVRYRNEYGPFQRIEDIMNVPGIKEAKFARIKDYITV